MEKVTAGARVNLSTLKLFYDSEKSRVMAIVGSLIILFVILSLFVPNFFSSYNLINILVQSSSEGVMTVGLTFVLITGGIDLSLPAGMSVAGILGAQFMVAHHNYLMGIIVMLIVGCAIGGFNGFLVSQLKLVPFIATLATMTIWGGFAIWVTRATTIFGLPAQFIKNINGTIGLLPIPVTVFAFALLLGYYMLHYTDFGRKVYSIGINSKTVRISGISVQRITFAVYLIAGLFGGIAAVLTTARLGAASSSMGGSTVVLDIISAAVIGGVSIYGGRGTVLGVMFGVLFITLITNTMDLLNIPFFTTLMVKGLIIVLVTLLDRYRTRAS